MDEETESLLLRRSLGRACPEDYVTWAVARLCADADSPALRILAGLSARLDRDEIEPHFILSCAELRIDERGGSDSPLAIAQMIRRAYDAGRAPPAETVEMMAQVYESSGCSEELLAPWYNVREALSWGEAYYYPLHALESVERAVELEWSLLDRALALSLPKGWMSLVRCKDCQHTGQVRIKGPSATATLWAALRRRHAISVVECERCGSNRVASLSDPDARGAYLDEAGSTR